MNFVKLAPDGLGVDILGEYLGFSKNKKSKFSTGTDLHNGFHLFESLLVVITCFMSKKRRI